MNATLKKLLEMETRIVEDKINIIRGNASNIAWLDFSDRFYIPLEQDEAERRENSLNHALIKIVMPHGSELHLSIMHEVAEHLGARWVTYDWLTKVLSRLFAPISCSELRQAVNLSCNIKEQMQRKNLNRVSSLQELYS